MAATVAGTMAPGEAGSQRSSTFEISGSENTEAEVVLHHAVIIGRNAFLPQRELKGGAGAAAALVILNRFGRVLWFDVVIDVPDSSIPVSIVPAAVVLPSGAYLLELLGHHPYTFSVDGDGIGPAAIATTRPTRDRMFVASFGDSIASSSWLDTVQLTRDTPFMLELAGDSGITSSSHTDECVAWSQSPTCIRPSTQGTEADYSGPCVVVACVTTQHSQVTFERLADIRQIPNEHLTYRGDDVAAGPTWHAFLEFTHG